MIFSNKIFKINNGSNPTLFAIDKNSMCLYLFNKTLKKYMIQLNNNKNCVFVKNYDHSKIIHLDDKIICHCLNGFMTIEKKSES